MSDWKTPDFVDLPIGAVTPETAELHTVAFDAVPADMLAAYTNPGQYVQVKTGEGKPGFFALACGPSSGKLELLVKNAGEAAEALCTKKAGETVGVSAPAGKGFPLNEAQGKDVYLVGAGSGLAPLRAVVHAILAERDAYKKVVLFHGMRGADGFPYRDEVGGWAANGVEVVRVVSRPAAGSWQGATGHVQQALQAHVAPVAPDACFFACGMKPMVEDLKKVVAEKGGNAERVFLNF